MADNHLRADRTGVAVFSSGELHRAIVLPAGIDHDDFEDHRLTFSNQRPVIARHTGKLGDLQPLNRCFDPPQGVAAQRHFVRGEDQQKLLIFAIRFQFGESELVERQEKGAVCRNFNA